MNAWMHRYKPAASARTHLLAAAGLWTLVGSALLTVGAIWLTRRGGPVTVLVLAVAVGFGLLKARLVLRKTARRIADRIQARGDGRCLGGFLSWQSWMLVLAMMVMGRLLRSGLLSVWIVGAAYAAIGTALLVASITLWRRWARPTVPAPAWND